MSRSRRPLYWEKYAIWAIKTVYLLVLATLILVLTGALSVPTGIRSGILIGSMVGYLVGGIRVWF